MTRSAPPACRRLIAIASRLVPRARRADWVREWESEVAWSAARSGIAGWRLAARCLGAFVHAAWLLQDRWRSEMLVQDLAFALRALVRRPLFAAVSVLTLALGIGANAAMFGAVRAVLLRPLPYPEPDRLVRLYTTSLESSRMVGSTSPPDFMDWRRDARSFRALAASASGAYALTGEGAAEQVPGSDVTGSFFDAMGVAPWRGRTLNAADETFGGPPVAVIGYGLWMRRFGGDASVVGRQVVLDGEPRQVVGIMPPGFAYPLESELWVPLRFSAEALATQRGAHYLDVVGRLDAAATLEGTQAEMRAIGARLAQAYPKTNWDTGSAVEPLHEAIVGDVRPALLVLMGAVGFVLLIVCVNLAGLVLAQSLGRARELAIRRTLGAGRGRLVLGMLLESLLLGLAGGAGGLVLAVWLTRAIAASAEGLGIPLLDQARVDAGVMAFTALLAILATALFGALPAWQAGAGRDLAGRMRADGPQVAGGRRRVRGLLIVTQTALAVVLLVGAGLLARSFAHLRSVDIGFDPARAQTFTVTLPGARYGTPEQRARFVETLLDRIRSRPGVQSAGAVFGLPMTAFGYTISARQLDGRMLDDREGDRLGVHLRAATPDYFRAMGIRVTKGRAFEPADREGAPLAVVISEAAAALLWPNQDPIGHSIELGTTLGQEERRAGGAVVGVVADVRHRGPGQPVRATVYVAHAQSPTDFVSFVVRSSQDASALLPLLRADLEAIDRDVPMFQVRTLEQIASDSVARPRLYMALLGLFAATAVLLASLGLYGVLAQTVGQRTREIGIRMAVGAERRQVILLVLRQGGRLALVGIALGLAGATIVSRSLRGLLVGVTPVDVPTYAAVGATLFAVALVASFIPARRAAHVDPVRALRTE